MNKKQTLLKRLDVGKKARLKILPKIIGILRKENIDMFTVISEFIFMSRQSELHPIGVSYFDTDVFPGNIQKTVVYNKDVQNFFLHMLKERAGKHPKIIKYYVSYERGNINFCVFIKEPNWELEELIYNIYGDTLDKFPTHKLNLEITEFFGQKE